MMRIHEQPMECIKCGHACILDDCNIDDPFGDGSIGCPIDDCGGEMLAESKSVKKMESHESNQRTNR